MTPSAGLDAVQRTKIADLLGRRRVQISVRWFPAGSGESSNLAATILDTPAGDWPDIAILTVPEAAGCPCVILDAGEVLADTPLLTAGYPAKASMEFQPQRFTAGF